MPSERDDVESCRFFQLSTNALICPSFCGVNFICSANRATLPSPRFASELLGVTVNFLQATCHGSASVCGEVVDALMMELPRRLQVACSK
jgi:hypothetical protein